MLKVQNVLRSNHAKKNVRPDVTNEKFNFGLPLSTYSGLFFTDLIIVRVENYLEKLFKLSFYLD